MNPKWMMKLLAEACDELEAAGEHAAAAYVGHAMDLIADRYDVPLPPGPPAPGDPG